MFVLFIKMKLMTIEIEKKKMIEKDEIIKYFTKQIYSYKKHICQVKENIRIMRVIIAQVEILNASISNGLVNGSSIEIIEPSQNIGELLEDLMIYHQELNVYREYLHEHIIERVGISKMRKIFENCKIEKEKHNACVVCEYKNIYCKNIQNIICGYIG